MGFWACISGNKWSNFAAGSHCVTFGSCAEEKLVGSIFRLNVTGFMVALDLFLFFSLSQCQCFARPNILELHFRIAHKLLVVKKMVLTASNCAT